MKKDPCRGANRITMPQHGCLDCGSVSIEHNHGKPISARIQHYSYLLFPKFYFLFSYSSLFMLYSHLTTSIYFLTVMSLLESTPNDQSLSVSASLRSTHPRSIGIVRQPSPLDSLNFSVRVWNFFFSAGRKHSFQTSHIGGEWAKRWWILVDFSTRNERVEGMWTYPWLEIKISNLIYDLGRLGQTWLLHMLYTSRYDRGFFSPRQYRISSTIKYQLYTERNIDQLGF